MLVMRERRGRHYIALSCCCCSQQREQSRLVVSERDSTQYYQHRTQSDSERAKHQTVDERGEDYQ